MVYIIQDSMWPLLSRSAVMAGIIQLVAYLQGAPTWVCVRLLLLLFLVMVVERIKDLTKKALGKEFLPITPLLFVVLASIVALNLRGLFPYLLTITTMILFTFTLFFSLCTPLCCSERGEPLSPQNDSNRVIINEIAVKDTLFQICYYTIHER